MSDTNRVAVVGVGYSTTGRNTGLTSRQLAIQAGKAAMEDAGMLPGDIDGVACLWGTGINAPPGAEVLDSQDAAYMLGINPLNWFDSVGMSPAYVGAAVHAIAAIRAGFCHTVITFRVLPQRLSTGEVLAVKQTGPRLVGGDAQFTEPFGAGLPLNWVAALPTQRHMALYGTTEEQFGAHVIAQRHHASLNADAIFRTPLTMDDYLSSRYVAKPVRLLDCDYPVDSGSAIIYTTEERARDWKKKPVFVEAAAYSSIRYLTFELVDLKESSQYHTAKTLWSRTDLTPADVDCAQLYDGFTITALQWLEALGFCGEGESGPFVQAGETRLGGSLPLNTDGGACNVGRRHGANYCIEAVRQLRGECGPRQVPNARVAAWANGAGFYSGAILMTAD